MATLMATMSNCDVRCITRTDTHIWTGERDGSIFAIDLTSKQPREIPLGPKNHFVICMTTDALGNVWAGFSNGDIRVWNGQTLLQAANLQQHHSSVNCLSASDDFVYSATEDSHIFKWDIHTHELALRFHTSAAHSGAIHSIAACGLLLYSASMDRTVRQWNTETGESTKELVHKRPVRACCKVGPDHLWTGSEDGELRVWDTNTHRSVRTLALHKAAVHCILPAGSAVWTGGADGTIGVWDVTSLALLESKQGQGSVHAIHVANHWQRFEVWSSGDKSVRIWTSEQTVSALAAASGNRLVARSPHAAAGAATAISTVEELARARLLTEKQSVRIAELERRLAESNQQCRELEHRGDELQRIFDERTAALQREVTALRGQAEIRAKALAGDYSTTRGRSRSPIGGGGRDGSPLASASSRGRGSPPPAAAVAMDEMASRSPGNSNRYGNESHSTTERLLAQVTALEEEVLLGRSSLRESEAHVRRLKDQLAAMERMIRDCSRRIGLAGHSKVSAISTLQSERDIHNDPVAPKLALENLISCFVSRIGDLAGGSGPPFLAPGSEAELQIRSLESQRKRLEGDLVARDDAISRLRAKAEELQAQHLAALAAKRNELQQRDSEIAELSTQVSRLREELRGGVNDRALVEVGKGHPAAPRQDDVGLAAEIRLLTGCLQGEELKIVRRAVNDAAALRFQVGQGAQPQPQTTTAFEDYRRGTQGAPSPDLQRGYAELTRLNEQLLQLHEQRSMKALEDGRVIAELTERVRQLKQERNGGRNDGSNRSRTPPNRNNSSGSVGGGGGGGKGTSSASLPSTQSQLQPLTAERLFVQESRLGLVRNIGSLHEHICRCESRAQAAVREMSKPTKEKVTGKEAVLQQKRLQEMVALRERLSGLRENSRWLLATFLTHAEKQSLGLDLALFRPDAKAADLFDALLREPLKEW